MQKKHVASRFSGGLLFLRPRVASGQHEECEVGRLWETKMETRHFPQPLGPLGGNSANQRVNGGIGVRSVVPVMRRNKCSRPSRLLRLKVTKLGSQTEPTTVTQFHSEPQSKPCVGIHWKLKELPERRTILDLRWPSFIFSCNQFILHSSTSMSYSEKRSRPLGLNVIFKFSDVFLWFHFQNRKQSQR